MKDEAQRRYWTFYDAINGYYLKKQYIFFFLMSGQIHHYFLVSAKID